MRADRWIVGVGTAALSLVASGIVGCHHNDTGAGGSTSVTGSGSTTTTVTGSGSTTGTSSTGSGAACSPGPACMAANKDCIGLVDNAGQTKFGLRISELDVTSPDALTSGIIKTTVAGNVTPNLAACNLTGTATLSLLLQFDTAAMTLKTGGAKPVSDSTLGYAFDDEMINVGGKTLHVQPVTYSGVKPDASGGFAVSAGQDAFIPVFLDDTGTSAIVLPIRGLRVTMGTLSSNNNCIGMYNAAGLDPANSCKPDNTHPQFLTGGTLDGYMTLEDADTVVVSSIAETLCVLMSGNASMYGMQMGPNTVCKRDAGGNILFQGNWCSTTNMAGGCADSVHLTANFAASSVKINN